MPDCEHEKTTITVDEDGTEVEKCIICDDVETFTLDDS